MPILEDLGLRVVEERPTRLDLAGAEETWLQDFGVLGPDAPLDLDAVGSRVAECIIAVWQGQAESDSLNRLVVVAGLNWRQINVLRAYRRYRQRIGSRFTESYQNDVIAANPHVTAKLMLLFEQRFDPDRRVDEAADAACGQRSSRTSRTSPPSSPSQQRFDGSWIGEPFAVAPNRGWHVSAYSSTTLTTALCYDALAGTTRTRRQRLDARESEAVALTGGDRIATLSSYVPQAVLRYLASSADRRPSLTPIAQRRHCCCRHQRLHADHGQPRRPWPTGRPSSFRGRSTPTSARSSTSSGSTAGTSPRSSAMR